MFNNKKYHEVNREERHFGFMLVSELLNNKHFRNLVFTEINYKCNASLDPENFDIYTEVAALRDYWNDLGDAGKYSVETHSSRYTVLREILSHIGYEYVDIDKTDVFWTSKDQQKRKLWCPAKWNIEELARLESNKNDLVKVRWCFNAKPDVMIESPGHVVLLELKLESAEGNNIHGYSQYEIQKMIGQLMKLLIPCYRNFKFENVSLELQDTSAGLNWTTIISYLKKSKRDDIGFDKAMKTFARILNY